MTCKVLSIDDDPAMTELLALLLKTHGYEPISANNGIDGIKAVRESSPDVVILDLNDARDGRMASLFRSPKI